MNHMICLNWQSLKGAHLGDLFIVALRLHIAHAVVHLLVSLVFCVPFTPRQALPLLEARPAVRRLRLCAGLLHVPPRITRRTAPRSQGPPVGEQ